MNRATISWHRRYPNTDEALLAELDRLRRDLHRLVAEIAEDVATWEQQDDIATRLVRSALAVRRRARIVTRGQALS